jgi:hypothetical protein
MPFPLPLETLVGKPLMYLLFAVIGFGFGFVLEISGFGNSKKLAAQFYFKEMTVLKVMFTAIVVAMVLIFTMVGLGVLDFNQVWVNPTYLWPGIVGRRLCDRRLLSRHVAGGCGHFQAGRRLFCAGRPGRHLSFWRDCGVL